MNVFMSDNNKPTYLARRVVREVLRTSDEILKSISTITSNPYKIKSKIKRFELMEKNLDCLFKDRVLYKSIIDNPAKTSKVKTLVYMAFDAYNLEHCNITEDLFYVTIHSVSSKDPLNTVTSEAFIYFTRHFLERYIQRNQPNLTKDSILEMGRHLIPIWVCQKEIKEFLQSKSINEAVLLFSDAYVILRNKEVVHPLSKEQFELPILLRTVLFYRSLSKQKVNKLVALSSHIAEDFQASFLIIKTESFNEYLNGKSLSLDIADYVNITKRFYY